MNKDLLLKSIFVIISLSSVTGCSKSTAKEFLFGSSEGPDPFVIGTTLSPLEMIQSDNVTLPKPKPILTASQMPSRAKNASDILGLVTENTQTKSDIAKNLTEVTGTIQQNDTQIIDFEKFDIEMNNQYAAQESNGLLIPTLLGTKKAIDPTTREKLKKEQ
jgi:hypothetical protein